MADENGAWPFTATSVGALVVPMSAIGAAAILAVGALIQRVTGMGLALVASPFLVLVLGPTTGVQLLQVVGLVVCAISAFQLRGDINLRKVGVLFGAALLGLVPGVLVTRLLSEAWLTILIGSITVVALTSIAFLHNSRVFAGIHGTLIAGVLSGFMNVTAGVGGPPLVVYAAATEWAYAEYVSSVQLFFTGLNFASLIGRGFPHLTGTMWVLSAIAAALGLFFGSKIGASISDSVARKSVIVVAFVGSVAAILRGISAL